MLLFLAHTPFMVNRAFSATPAERLQQYMQFLEDALKNFALHFFKLTTSFSLSNKNLYSSVFRTGKSVISSSSRFYLNKRW